MDVRIRDVGSIGQGRDRVQCLVLEEREHVVGCLAKVVVSGYLEEGDGAGEPVDGEGVSDSTGIGDVTLIASVVFE